MLLLYAVTDRTWLSAAPVECGTLDRQVEEAILGGTTIIQLREKNLHDGPFIELAREIKRVTDAHSVPLIINDNLPVAIASDAAGLHIGQDDGDARQIRKRLGKNKILGVSAQTVAQALAAEADGADYLGVGAVLDVQLSREGRFVGGKILPTRQVGKELVQPDPDSRAVNLMRRLSRKDFAGSAVEIARDDSLIPPKQ